MKHHLRLILFFSFLIVTPFYAQEYNPVIKEGSFWDISHWENNAPCSTSMERYEIDTDIEIQGKIYKKIKHFFIYSNTYDPYMAGCLFEPLYYNTDDFVILDEYVREDVDERKLYLLSSKYTEDESYQEYVICDFTLEVGDVMENYLGQHELDLPVTNIYMIDGKMRYELDYGRVIFTEGIGPNNTIIAPIDKCFHVLDCGGTGISCYGNAIEGNNCATVLSTEENQANSSIRFYPNPVLNIFNIENLSTNSIVKIYTIEGKLVKQVKTTQKHSSLDLSALTKGFYFVKFSSSEVKIDKIIKILKQ